MNPRIREYDTRHRFLAFALVIATLLAVTAADGPFSATPPAAKAGSISLTGHVDIPSSAYDTDVWGWVDPVTLKEYALVGNNATGLHIVDCSNPASPVVVSTLDAVPSFDIKTYQHFAYTVDGNYGFAGVEGRIIDIADPANPVVVGTIPAGHNLFVDDEGFLYVTYPGLRILKLRGSPAEPQPWWEKVSTEGHDVTVVGDRLYDFHGYDGTYIYELANRRNPKLIGSILDPTITFHHSGCTSNGEAYLFINDEMAVDPSPDIIIFDISRTHMPLKVASIADPDATAHNSYRIGNFLHVAYYTAGYRVYDIAEPARPVLVDEYDTTPLTGEGLFKGAWGCYPFSPSGHIYVNDRPEGFFVFSFDETATGVGEASSKAFDLGQSYPNPFNPETTIPYRLSRPSRVELTVYDIAGKRVRLLEESSRPAGRHRAIWDAKDDHGRRVVSGVYFCRLEVEGVVKKHKMVLIR